jgi:hypothetical protein
MRLDGVSITSGVDERYPQAAVVAKRSRDMSLCTLRSSGLLIRDGRWPSTAEP